MFQSEFLCKKKNMDLYQFLIKLNDDLKKNNLKMVVIRNYQYLPSYNLGKDIDFIIKPEDLNKWLDIIQRFCSNRNLKVKISENNRSYYVKIKIIGVQDKTKNYLKIDLNYNFNWRGVEFYSINQLIEECILFNYPIYTSKKNYINSYITFCHSFLYGGFINQKYIKDFRKALITNKEEFEILFKKNFSKKQTKYLLNKLESINFKIPRYIANIIRIKVLFKSILKNPFITLNFLIKNYFNV